MNKCNVITYKLNKSVKPVDVVQALEVLMQKHCVNYKNCLRKLSCVITEFETEGVFHSNRSRNAILSICKKYPDFEVFFEHIKEDSSGYVFESFLLKNFKEKELCLTGTVDYTTIRDIITKIPRPYAINSLEVIFDGIGFNGTNAHGENIRPPQNGKGCPVGSYIYYSRNTYGTEKHSYIHFATDNERLESLRKFYFDFAELISGQYYGTEIKGLQTYLQMYNFVL